MDPDQRAEYGNDEGKYVAEHYTELKRQVLDCCLLNNFFWGVWALALLAEDQYTSVGIFNFDFASARCTFYELFCKQPRAELVLKAGYEMQCDDNVKQKAAVTQGD